MSHSQTRQHLGRAKNAIQEYLIHKLLVPKIYLEADWNDVSIDVLAIDRAGVGDVHAVSIVYRDQNNDPGNGELVQTARKVDKAIQELRLVPCQYRYVFIVGDDPYALKYSLSDLIVKETLAEDGVGRIGILSLDLSEGGLGVQAMIKPERFRSSSQIVELADQYVAAHTANWEVRD